jgi:tRNA-splicing ligase RtcB
MKHSREDRRPPHVAATPLHIWSPEPLPESVRTVIARIRRAEDVVHVAIMPDVHIAGPVCTGGVVATTRTIYPQAIGGDIGCGYAGVATDLNAEVLEEEARVARLFALLRERIPFMRHRSLSGAPDLPASVAAGADASPVLRRVLGREARIEFGTLGRGNHFVE